MERSPEPRVRPTGRRRGEGGRLNIADIAALANVSTSAVSYALNGRPGISEETRARILAIAEDAHWRPNRAAQALNTSRVGTIGIVTRLVGDQLPLWAADFGGQFLSGVLAEFSARDIGLILYHAADAAAEHSLYRRWRGERRVDGVLLMNPTLEDPRLPLLEELGMPTIVVGDVRRRSALPCVWTDDAHAAELAVAHLAELGHRNIARIGGDPQQIHHHLRERAFRRALARHGLADHQHQIGHGRADVDRLRELTTSGRDPLTAVIVEDNHYAMQIVEHLRPAGLTVPADLSVLTWDDSPTDRIVSPNLTALRRDLLRYGRTCATELLRVLGGEARRATKGTTTTLVVRESTAPPR